MSVRMLVVGRVALYPLNPCAHPPGTPAHVRPFTLALRAAAAAPFQPRPPMPPPHAARLARRPARDGLDVPREREDLPVEAAGVVQVGADGGRLLRGQVLVPHHLVVVRGRGGGPDAPADPRQRAGGFGVGVAFSQRGEVRRGNGEGGSASGARARLFPTISGRSVWSLNCLSVVLFFFPFFFFPSAPSAAAAAASLRFAATASGSRGQRARS